MDRHLQIIREISRQNDRKILLVVIDGLGGLNHPDHGDRTELQVADLPNLDAFVRDSRTETGMIHPVDLGYTPGSSTGHFGLFGYDPLHEGYAVGRGAMEAADLDIELGRNDILVRFNFCTLKDGLITDRRAGRTNRGRELVAMMNDRIRVPDAAFEATATREHRGVLVLRDERGEYGEEILDTDPGIEAAPARQAAPRRPDDVRAAAAARLFQEYADAAARVLSCEAPANAIIYRGFSRMPDLPRFADVFKLDAAAIATYPLYRGLARLVGMRVLERAADLEGQVEVLDRALGDHDYFFLHFKTPDSRGEDGDFEGKVRALEEFDRLFPAILRGAGTDVRFDTVAVTGDHSTPAYSRGHSHHPVPLAVHARSMRCFDQAQALDERECARGTLGCMRGPELMRLLMAACGKLGKFGG